MKKKRAKNKQKQLYKNEGLLLLEEGTILLEYKNGTRKARIKKTVDYRKKYKYNFLNFTIILFENCLSFLLRLFGISKKELETVKQKNEGVET